MFHKPLAFENQVLYLLRAVRGCETNAKSHWDVAGPCEMGGQPGGRLPPCPAVLEAAEVQGLSRCAGAPGCSKIFTSSKDLG